MLRTSFLLLFFFALGTTKGLDDSSLFSRQTRLCNIGGDDDPPRWWCGQKMGNGNCLDLGSFFFNFLGSRFPYCFATTSYNDCAQAATNTPGVIGFEYNGLCQLLHDAQNAIACPSGFVPGGSQFRGTGAIFGTSGRDNSGVECFRCVVL